MRTLRLTFISTLLAASAIFATGCASGGDETPEVKVAARQSAESSTAEAEALPDCSELASAPSSKVTPVIQQVAGSETLYVLLVGDTAVCSGEFSDVASSRLAQGGVVFDSDEWAGSNPMPGRTAGGIGNSNPMPGTPNPDADPPPSGSNPMPGKG